MTWLRERLPDDAIVTSDAGNFSGWPNRFLQYRRPGRQLGPTSGAMGYGVPAAVAAKLARPDRIVVGFVRRWRLPDDRAGAGDRRSPKGPARSSSSSTTRCTARSACTRSAASPAASSAPTSRTRISPRSPAPTAPSRRTVARTEEFAPAFEEAIAAKRAAIIELQMDPEMITTRTTLSALRRQAEAAKA